MAVASLWPRVSHLVTVSTMGVCFSKPEPVDEHLAKTTPKRKGKSQPGTQPVGTQPVGTQPVTQPVGTQPEGERQAGTPSKRKRVRDTTTTLLPFTTTTPTTHT